MLRKVKDVRERKNVSKKEYECVVKYKESYDKNELKEKKDIDERELRKEV
jgi:hypothetical protein